MAVTLDFDLYRSSLSGFLESGASPDGTFRHGDPFVLSDVAIPASTVYQREFSGGVDGIVDGLVAGATVANQGNWRFSLAAHNPVVYVDSERGKVMHNDYFAQADIDATKRIALNGVLGFGERLYYSRWVKPVVKTTGGVDYPMTSQLQWKTERFIAIDDIQDTSNNTGTQLVNFNWFTGGGKQYRRETGDGNISGASTGAGTTYTITDNTKNYGANTLKGRGIQLNGGTGDGQYKTIVSNTATTITVGTAFSPVPDATTTFYITNALDYGTGEEMLINSGWQFVEWFITANTNGNADGSIVKKVHRAGVTYTAINLTGIQLYADAAKYKYIQAQDYFGNAALTVESRNVYCDDIFLRHGSFDRVVLMDTTSVSTMTKFALQLDSSWSAGSVAGKLNTAGLTAGTYYLCAITGVDTVVYSQSVIIV